MENHKRLVVVTPCSRPENLPRVRASLDFDHVTTWYIVYDTSQRPYKKRYEDDPKVVELACADPYSINGNSQRNIALHSIAEGMVYLLDDDNAIHPDFWRLWEICEPGKIYTFDMVREDGNVQKGDHPVPHDIDSSQCLFDARLMGPTRFVPPVYHADGIFLYNLCRNHRRDWVYVPQVAAFWNRLRWGSI